MALTSTAVSSGQSSPAFDFKVSRLREQRWEIVPLSPRARIWSKINFDELLAPDGVLYTNLPGVCSFMTEARSQGLVSEYNGPIGTATL